MYTEFFGLTETPFGFSPDPSFLYLSPDHEEALRTIVCGVNERAGLIAIFGEAGTGKTTMLKTATGWLAPGTRVAFIGNFHLVFEDLLLLVLTQLGVLESDGIPVKDATPQRLRQVATEQLSNGGNFVLMVDEAERLNGDDLENLRLLSNLETSAHKLLQIVLSGQPELEKRLEDPVLSQLKQRINRRCLIKRLSQHETHNYIRHRLAIAGHSGPDFFDSHAHEAIWVYSDGIPRKINILCHNTLRITFERNVKLPTASIVTDAATELNW
jgi:general secretion pathway protein A